MQYVRVSGVKKKTPPAVTMYEVTNARDVSRIVQLDPDGGIFWESVAACSGPSEMIGINSLVEGRFPDEQNWPQSDRTIYEAMTARAFELWFKRAQEHGRRRTHAEMVAAMLKAKSLRA